MSKTEDREGGVGGAATDNVQGAPASSRGGTTGVLVGGTGPGAGTAATMATASGGSAGGIRNSADSGGPRGGSANNVDAGRSARLDASPDSPTRSCQLLFNATTISTRGAYGPANAGAVWIEDASGRFVKTLRAWSRFYLRDVTAWAAVSNDNVVDAITGATRYGHGPLPSTPWECTDIAHARVPDGSYSVCVSFSEDDPYTARIYTDASTPIMLCVPFELGARPFDVMAAGNAFFSNVELGLTL